MTKKNRRLATMVDSNRFSCNYAGQHIGSVAACRCQIVIAESVFIKKNGRRFCPPIYPVQCRRENGFRAQYRAKLRSCSAPTKYPVAAVDGARERGDYVCALSVCRADHHQAHRHFPHTHDRCYVLFYLLLLLPPVLHELCEEYGSLLPQLF